MSTGLPVLTALQQQQAAERILALIAEGMSSGQAIAQVAEEIRHSHRGERVVARFDEEE